MPRHGEQMQKIFTMDYDEAEAMKKVAREFADSRFEGGNTLFDAGWNLVAAASGVPGVVMSLMGFGTAINEAELTESAYGYYKFYDEVFDLLKFDSDGDQRFDLVEVEVWDTYFQADHHLDPTTGWYPATDIDPKALRYRKPSGSWIEVQ